MQGFWDQFKPGIECAGVEPLGTNEITLADIEPYQRFDSDWVSFDDDTVDHSNDGRHGVMSMSTAPSVVPGWERLRHGGLLFDGTRLEQLSQFVPFRTRRIYRRTVAPARQRDSRRQR